MEALEDQEDQEDPVIALGRDPIQISLTENSQKPFVLRAPTWVRSGWSSGRDMIALLIRFEKSCASWVGSAKTPGIGSCVITACASRSGTTRRRSTPARMSAWGYADG